MNSRARITVIPALLASAVGFGSLPTVFAHQTPAATGMQPAGLPELKLVVEETGVTGMPESIEAGRYLVTVSGPAVGEMGPYGVLFAQFPEGVTPESAQQDLLDNPEGLPSWYMETHFAGGVTLSQGTESWGVIDLTPGDWVAALPFGATLPIAFEVTGEFPTDLAPVEASVTINLLEMTIDIAEGAFVAGDNVVTLTNTGEQLHFVDVSMVPAGTTAEQVEALMESFMTGTPPPADGLQENDFMPVAYLADISPGVSETLPLTLETGTYFLACWVHDTESGAPHAMMGMWDIVVIE